MNSYFDFEDDFEGSSRQTGDQDFDNYWNQEGVFEDAVDDRQDQVAEQAEERAFLLDESDD